MDDKTFWLLMVVGAWLALIIACLNLWFNLKALCRLRRQEQRAARWVDGNLDKLGEARDLKINSRYRNFEEQREIYERMRRDPGIRAALDPLYANFHVEHVDEAFYQSLLYGTAFFQFENGELKPVSNHLIGPASSVEQCRFCGFVGNRVELARHLTAEHSEQVFLEFVNDFTYGEEE